MYAEGNSRSARGCRWGPSRRGGAVVTSPFFTRSKMPPLPFETIPYSLLGSTPLAFQHRRASCEVSAVNARSKLSLFAILLTAILTSDIAISDMSAANPDLAQVLDFLFAANLAPPDAFAAAKNFLEAGVKTRDDIAALTPVRAKEIVADKKCHRKVLAALRKMPTWTARPALRIINARPPRPVATAAPCHRRHRRTKTTRPVAGFLRS